MLQMFFALSLQSFVRLTSKNDYAFCIKFKLIDWAGDSHSRGKATATKKKKR
jgi:hypothetical protein